MAFRKRNIGIGQPPGRGPAESIIGDSALPGVRSSPLTSHPVTSTGTSSLDGLLGGHGGIALGTSLLIEESGNTDFSGVLLKCFAAEGLCQGHILHVVGLGERWSRELPDVVEDKPRNKHSEKADEEKMKIAWRYERLRPASERASPDRSVTPLSSNTPVPESAFCHTFDLTKRLAVSSGAQINYNPVLASSTFEAIIANLSRTLASSPRGKVHRLVVPSLLSPALYPPDASRPEAFLSFLRSLRSLLRQYTSIFTAMISFPLELYPRNSGLVRWAEILSDGVIEFTPFPHLKDSSNELARSGGAKDHEEQPQGLVHVHRLPINTERGEGGSGAGNSIGEDLAFTVSRRNFRIKPFSLPPVEGDQDAQKEAGKLTGKDIEF